MVVLVSRVADGWNIRVWSRPVCPAHLSVIIPIEVTHKNVPSIAADFTPGRGPDTASVLGAFLRLKLHFDPRSCLARRGELAEPTI